MGVQDMVFNLSLRMLGTVPDAEDAAQEILVKVMTRLASFRGESSFATWVFRVAANHLKTCRKGMFAAHPLSFELYGEDIASGRERDLPDLSGGVDRALLEQELQALLHQRHAAMPGPGEPLRLHPGHHVPSGQPGGGRGAGADPEAYRQRLSRARKKMAAFLGRYCGLGGGVCACAAGWITPSPPTASTRPPLPLPRCLPVSLTGPAAHPGHGTAGPALTGLCRPAPPTARRAGR